MKVIEGKVVSGSAGKIKVGIVAARFNEFIVSKLVAGAKDGLVRHDVEDDDITLCWVPGAFEIPVAAKKMAESKKYDAITGEQVLKAFDSGTHGYTVKGQHRYWQESLSELGGEKGILELFKKNCIKVGLPIK